MRTYALLSQKGGAGKSTLARQLACLAGEVGPSFLIDRDPQKTASNWWNRRQENAETPEQPVLLDCGSETLTSVVGKLKGRPGAVFVDTRPAVTEPEAEAARAADLILVPVRTSSDDLEAVGDTLKIVRRLDRRAVLIVNAAKSGQRATEARATLGAYPFPVCPIHLADRAVYLDAALEGRGLAEMKGAAARQAEAELRRVWDWIREIDND